MQNGFYSRLDEIKALRLTAESAKDIKLYRGKGCDQCSHTGFRGRKGIFEMLVINDKIRELIFESVPAHVIREKAREFGMKTLREDGIKKVLGGMTTIEEVMRVTQADQD